MGIGEIVGLPPAWSHSTTIKFCTLDQDAASPFERPGYLHYCRAVLPPWVLDVLPESEIEPSQDVRGYIIAEIAILRQRKTARVSTAIDVPEHMILKILQQVMLTLVERTRQ